MNMKRPFVVEVIEFVAHSTERRRLLDVSAEAGSQRGFRSEGWNY
jgi:hypothetical protein